jgi:sporadic carbohydrate cluster 2OG-Fe(II) oxygenase/sporadic carbohydrate cluster protein (TIGR04323 family)
MSQFKVQFERNDVLSTVGFDTTAFPFDSIVTECVRDYLQQGPSISTAFSDLSALHKFIGRSQLGDVYEAIYDLFLTRKFADPYDRLCSEIANKMFRGKAAYQRIPSVRIQMPGQISVNYHTDEWYGHGYDVQNFWLPLVSVSATNSMFVANESTSREVTRTIRTGRKSITEINELARSVCSPLNMSFGEIFCFNSHIIHGTEMNATDKTRVSFDFRMLLDGADRGLKDESFFVHPGERSHDKPQKAAVGVIYIGKQEGFTKIISQKNQVLLCNRYARENGISSFLSETELNGFTHHPVLWNMICGNHAETFRHLIFFSALLLPTGLAELKHFIDECEARNLTLHFVAEDIVGSPGRMAEAVDGAIKRSQS